MRISINRIRYGKWLGVVVTLHDETHNWAASVEASLSASLLLGRTSARSIAKAHLSELFKLVGPDFDSALTEVAKVESYASRRLLMECFRLTFSLNQEKPEYAALLTEVDFTEKKSAYQYDQALLGLLRHCGGDREAVAIKVANYPIARRKVVIQRLDHSDFQRARRIKVNHNYLSGFLSSPSSESPWKWWHWGILIAAFSVIIQMLNK